MGFDTQSALFPRLIDTVLGSAIAWFAVSYLWPDWKYLQLDKVSRQAIQSDAQYFFTLLANCNLVKAII